MEATDGSGRKTVIQTVTVVKEQQRLLLQGGENGCGVEPGDRSEDGRHAGAAGAEAIAAVMLKGHQTHNTFPK